MDTVSLGLIVKDENEYLREWVDYHRLIGVERFYIYDHASRISPRDLLAHEVQTGLVVITPIQGLDPQLEAYADCLDRFGANTAWLGFIDADEFIVPKTGENLADFLRPYEPYAGLGINWQIYGANGHQSRPAGGVLANYLRRTPDDLLDNLKIKSIVRPEQVLAPKSPHHFIYKPGSYCVNEKGERIDDQSFPHSTQKIQINHYWSRSRDEFAQKQQKWADQPNWRVDWARFERYDALSTENDPAGLEAALSRIPARLSPGSPFLERLALAVAALDPPAPLGQPQVTAPAGPVVERAAQVRAAHRHIQNAVAPDRVEEALLSAARQFPSYPMYLLNLAEWYTDQGRFSPAWATLEEAGKLTGEGYETLMRWGYFYQKTGRFEAAEAAYRKALRIDPHGYRTALRLGETLFQAGKLDQAFTLVRETIQASRIAVNDPPVLQLIKLLTVGLFRGGRVTEAQELACLALPAHPADLDLLTSLGRIEYGQGHAKAALSYLQRAAALAPDDADIAAGLKLVMSAVARRA